MDLKILPVLFLILASNLVNVSNCGLISKLMGKKGGHGSSGGNCGSSRLMSALMMGMCRPMPQQWQMGGNQFGGSQWGSSSWPMQSSGYYPGFGTSSGFGSSSNFGSQNSFPNWPSYGGASYPSGGNYGSNFGTSGSQWSPWSYGQNGWQNNWGGGGQRKAKGHSDDQSRIEQRPIGHQSIKSSSQKRNIPLPPSVHRGHGDSSWGNHLTTKSVSSRVQVPQQSDNRFITNSGYNVQVPKGGQSINHGRSHSSHNDNLIVQQEII